MPLKRDVRNGSVSVLSFTAGIGRRPSGRHAIVFDVYQG